MQPFAISLPVPGGSLNCTIARPTLGINKQFRKAARKVLELKAGYEAGVNSLIQIQTGPNPSVEAVAKLQALLDQADIDSYQSLIDQASLVLVVQGFTPNGGPEPAPNHTPTISDVVWDDVENAKLNSITSFFSESINA